jgi:hypothetical protein
MDIQFVFRGSFQPDERDALRRAITNLEQRQRTRQADNASSTAGGPAWAVYSIDRTGKHPIRAAFRLADGRAFRAASHLELLDALQAEAGEVDTD